MDVLWGVKSEWESLIDIQLVALVPMEYWLTQDGRNLARKVGNNQGLLGGVVSPPYQKQSLRDQLFELLCIHFRKLD